MNPFDLRGPEFLVFYVLFLGGMFALYEYFRRTWEPSLPPKANLSDPYEIAFLRGGKNEAFRVATVSLIDRGLIKVNKTVLLAEQNASGLVKRRIEEAVISKFQVSGKATTLFSASGFGSVCKAYEEELIRLGLMPTIGQKRNRLIWKIFMIAVALLTAAHKIDVAMQRGHSNIGFLIMLGIGFTVLLLGYSSPRTPAGDKFLSDLRILFAR